MELPHIEKFYREFKSQGVGLVTVTADPAAEVLPMVEYNGITHPIVCDADTPKTDSVYAKYHAYDGKHYLIGSDGTILAAFSKLGVSLPILKREIARHGIGRSPRLLDGLRPSALDQGIFQARDGRGRF